MILFFFCNCTWFIHFHTWFGHTIHLIAQLIPLYKWFLDMIHLFTNDSFHMIHLSIQYVIIFTHDSFFLRIHVFWHVTFRHDLFILNQWFFLDDYFHMQFLELILLFDSLIYTCGSRTWFTCFHDLFNFTSK